MNKTQAVGLLAFVVWLLSTVGLFLTYTTLLALAGISFPSKYAPITKTFILATISLWTSQAVVSVPRLILRVLITVGAIKGTTYSDFGAPLKTVHSVSIWALGSITAMTAYLAQWLT